MNLMQNKNCMYNGHLKDVPITKHPIELYRYNKHDRDMKNDKVRLSDKYKVLIENGDNREDDPYTFNEVEPSMLKYGSNNVGVKLSSQSYQTSCKQIPHMTTGQFNKTQDVRNTKLSSPLLTSMITNTTSHDLSKTNNYQYKQIFQTVKNVNNINKIGIKTNSTNSSCVNKQLSYTKLKNAFNKNTGLKQINNNERKFNISRSVSLDSDITSTHLWNSTKKTSLLEESLLGLKSYNGKTKDVKSSLLLHGGTTTVLIPNSNKTKKNGLAVKTSSRHDSLQRIWTVRNKIVRLKNDHTQFGTDIGYNDSELESENEFVAVQNHWFSLCNDTELLSYKDRRREAKLTQTKLEYRHKLKQMNWQVKDEYRDSMVDILIQSARVQPNLTALLVHLCNTNNTSNQFRLKSTAASRSLCAYTDSTNNIQCDYLAIPLSNYCQQHIVYCQEQMLFTMCSAAYCKAPVLDHIVESPLCLEHKRLKLLSQKPKKQIAQTRKRSRSSTGSGRSGRSRKRKRNAKEKKSDDVNATTNYVVNSSVLTTTTTAATSAHHSVDTYQTGVRANNLSQPQHSDLPYMGNSLSNLNAQVISKSDVDECQEVEVLADLPLDTAELATQATRLLEEHDFTNVLNHIPADAFNDLFTVDKGEYEPTPQETEELERALEAVDKDVKSLEKLSQTQGILETLLDEQAAIALAAAHLPTTLVPVLYQNGGYVEDVGKNIIVSEGFQTADVKQS